MDGLELDMRQCRLEQRRGGLRLIVQEAFERPHARRDLLRRRRDESGIAGTRAADPVLTGTEFAGIACAATAIRQEFLMHLAQKAQGEREAVAKSSQAVVHGSDVVADLAHVVEGDAGLFLHLEKQEVGEGRLRAFDHRREHRLLANVRVEKERDVGQEQRNAVQTAQSHQGIVKPLAERGDQSIGGEGGNGTGTKARTCSPTVETISY
jgi:hypothetical protein